MMSFTAVLNDLVPSLKSFGKCSHQWHKLRMNEDEEREEIKGSLSLKNVY